MQVPSFPSPTGKALSSTWPRGVYLIDFRRRCHNLWPPHNTLPEGYPQAFRGVSIISASICILDGTLIYCRIVMRYSTTNKDTVFSTPPTHRHVVEQKLLVAAGQGECGRLTRRTRFSSTGNGQQARTWPLPPSLFGRLAMNDSLSIFSTVRDRSAELLKGEPAPCTWTSRSMTCGGQAVRTRPMHEPK